MQKAKCKKRASSSFQIFDARWGFHGGFLYPPLTASIIKVTRGHASTRQVHRHHHVRRRVHGERDVSRCERTGDPNPRPLSLPTNDALVAPQYFPNKTPPPRSGCYWKAQSHAAVVEPALHLRGAHRVLERDLEGPGPVLGRHHAGLLLPLRGRGGLSHLQGW